MRAVRFDHYGGREVLSVVDLEDPVAAVGEVVVEVRAAGINPGEAAIRQGALAAIFPATFPSGEGSDLAGVITAVGDGVTDFRVGDEVMGWSWRRSSHAESVAVPVTQLIPKPPALAWEVAGSLYVVGCTAFAAVRAIDAGEGDVVVVSAAAGGVGTVVVQLLGTKGATVIGIASERNHDWLTAHGATPVAYGADLAARILAVAPDGVDSFIDLFGPQYLDLAVELGIPVERIETVAARDKAAEIGAKAEGGTTASTPEVLSEMAELVVSGQIEIPIAATYPLERVVDAFAELEERHTRGKIVLIP